MQIHIFPPALLWLALLAPAADAAPSFVPRFARDEIEAMPVAVEQCDKPVYPKASLRNEETGMVVVSFKIDRDGAILGSSVVRSSGFRDLDKSAVAGFLTCKFRPSTINGQPVRGYGRVAYHFTLD